MRGDELKKLREKHNYSRDELANVLCVTPSIIQSWEQGWSLQNPSSGEIEEMAQVFNMDEDELRCCIGCDVEDDSDNDTEVRFIDYIDSVVKASDFLKKHK